MAKIAFMPTLLRLPKKWVENIKLLLFGMNKTFLGELLEEVGHPLQHRPLFLR
jgi:hypothetical protein